MLKPIYDITSYTLVDYPNHSSCVIWFSGCNLKCQYCYNPEILPFNSGTKSVEDLLNFLDTRIGLLDAVVLSGGEATSFKDLLILCRQIKEKGFKIKLDTNGTNPIILESILKEKLLDFISLDIKAGTSEQFNKVIDIKNSKLLESVKETLTLLNYKYDIAYECRTTIHSDLFSIDDIRQCINLAYNFGYRGKYALQLSLDNVNTLNNLKNSSTYNKDELIDISKLDIEFRNFI